MLKKEKNRTGKTKNVEYTVYITYNVRKSHEETKTWRI